MNLKNKGASIINLYKSQTISLCESGKRKQECEESTKQELLSIPILFMPNISIYAELQQKNARKMKNYLRSKIKIRIHRPLESEIPGTNGTSNVR